MVHSTSHFRADALKDMDQLHDILHVLPILTFSLAFTVFLILSNLFLKIFYEFAQCGKCFLVWLNSVKIRHLRFDLSKFHSFFNLKLTKNDLKIDNFNLNRPKIGLKKWSPKLLSSTLA